MATAVTATADTDTSRGQPLPRWPATPAQSYWRRSRWSTVATIITRRTPRNKPRIDTRKYLSNSPLNIDKMTGLQEEIFSGVQTGLIQIQVIQRSCGNALTIHRLHRCMSSNLHLHLRSRPPQLISFFYSQNCIKGGGIFC